MKNTKSISQFISVLKTNESNGRCSNQCQIIQV